MFMDRRLESEQCQCVTRTLLKFYGAKVLGTFTPEERMFLDFSLLGGKCSTEPTERKFSLWTFCSCERKCSGTKSPDTPSRKHARTGRSKKFWNQSDWAADQLIAEPRTVPVRILFPLELIGILLCLCTV